MNFQTSKIKMLTIETRNLKWKNLY
jgi:hypothetical protein